MVARESFMDIWGRYGLVERTPTSIGPIFGASIVFGGWFSVSLRKGYDTPGNRARLERFLRETYMEHHREQNGNGYTVRVY